MSNAIPFRVNASEVAIVCGALVSISAAGAGPTNRNVNAETRRIVPRIPGATYDGTIMNRIARLLMANEPS